MATGLMNKPVKCGCGGEAFVSINDFIEYHVFCALCGMRTDWFRSKNKAIEVWNRAMGGVVTYPCTTVDGVYTSGCTITNTSSPNDDFHPVLDCMVGKERTAKVIKHDACVTLEGLKFHELEHICGDCKKKVLGGDEYCSHCGAKLIWGEEHE